MSGDVHVRFWEGLGVRFPRPTRYNVFWTLDMAMGEDDGSPCQRGEALVLISWLRLLAYNVVSMWRSKLPTPHGEKPTWSRAFELFGRAFTSRDLLGPEDALATLL